MCANLTMLLRGGVFIIKKVNNAQCVAKTRNEAPVQAARDIKLTEKCTSSGFEIQKIDIQKRLKVLGLLIVFDAIKNLRFIR